MDYCDLMNLDLESLLFSELVNEKHIMMDTLVDIKTHIPKEHWVVIFSSNFAIKGQIKEYLTLREIQGMFLPSSRRRSMWTRIVRVISRTSAILGFFKFRKYPSQEFREMGSG